MNKTTTGAGTIFTILLQIAFIILKLCNVITWSWVFVLMPLIVSGGLIVIALIAFIILAVLGDMD